MLELLFVDKKTFILLLTVFIDLIGFGIVIPILPLLIKQIGGGTVLVGTIISIFSLFQFLFSPVLGRLSDKYGRKPVLILSSFLNSMSYFLIFFSQQIWIVVLARILAGIAVPIFRLPKLILPILLPHTKELKNLVLLELLLV